MLEFSLAVVGCLKFFLEISLGSNSIILNGKLNPVTIYRVYFLFVMLFIGLQFDVRIIFMGRNIFISDFVT